MGQYVVVTTAESDETGRPKMGGAINGGFYQKTEDPVSNHLSVVITEGTVRAKKRDNGFVYLVFCDVFVMKDSLIKQLISYLMEVKYNLWS